MTADARSLSSQQAASADDPAVTALVRELRAGSPEFARLWDLHDVEPALVHTKTFQHPVVGPVRVDCDTLLLTDADQRLVLYTAPVGSPDADALAMLGTLGPGASRAAQPTASLR